MFHATTADRNASGAGEVISEDHQFGYAIHELCLSKTEGDRLLAAEEGTSLYCIGGRGWASFPGGNARYALEPGTVFAVTTPGRGVVVSAVEDLTILRVDDAPRC
ncbi:hypothetical protein [Arthrobacter sp. CG_A4]|uniref:hypothetical protein n=1 Tax=Arthrobacter sp. CG_A4 TaxID=3071706 RepID=UPI002DFCC1B2|nr:hypothetical protein [Arthrobacter sp. CG_A4]